MNKWTIIVGNPIDGISIHGVFNSFENAEEFASTYYDSDWYIVEIYEA